MSEQGNGSEGYIEEEPDELAELKDKFMRLMLKRAQVEETITGGAERRAAHMEIHKEMMRAAFLSNDLASEEDFERLWPRLRDDALCDHAEDVYMQVMAALADEFADGDLPPEDPHGS